MTRCTTRGQKRGSRVYLLNHAEFVANQADCPNCGSYGRLELAGEPQADGSTPVRCRQCAHPWQISD